MVCSRRVLFEEGKEEGRKKELALKECGCLGLVRNRRMVMIKVKERGQTWRTETSLYRARVKRASIQRSIPDMGCITGL